MEEEDPGEGGRRREAAGGGGRRRQPHRAIISKSNIAPKITQTSYIGTLLLLLRHMLRCRYSPLVHAGGEWRRGSGPDA